MHQPTRRRGANIEFMLWLAILVLSAIAVANISSDGGDIAERAKAEAHPLSAEGRHQAIEAALSRSLE